MIEEYPFRLRPRRPRYQRDESKVWARGFQQLMHLVRMTTKPSTTSGSAGRSKSAHRHQRCAVRVTYSSNKIRGQWGAHGRYIERDSANAASFGSTPPPVTISKTLEEWQKAGDERLFKLVLSPEFGERLDPERLTRDAMAAIENDTGHPLEWTAVIHRNTEHPHVHIALRGVAGGHPLRFARDYIKHGIRRHAEAAATQQLGYRTSLDMEEVERREITQPRFTSLDRILCCEAFIEPVEQRLIARLNYLTEIGLAEQIGPMRWQLRPDFESTLRAFQRAQDRQKMLAEHAAFLSDPRLQFRVVTPDAKTEIVGRVITHVLDGVADRPYALIEGIDGVVYYLPHNSAIAAARANGQLKPNAFVMIPPDDAGVHDLGDADRLLSNPKSLKSVIRRLLQRGILQERTESWSGWLGKFHGATRKGGVFQDPTRPDHRPVRSR